MPDTLRIPSFKNVKKWFERKKSFIGLDIGSSSIKIVELAKREAQAVLETYGELNIARWLQEHPTADSSPPGPEVYSSMVSDLLRESRVVGRHAIASIPVSQSFILPIELPVLAPEELKAAIPFEARRYIPVPLEEMSLEWYDLGRYERPAPVARILLVAVPREVIARYGRIAEGAGLSLLAQEPEPFSVVRSGMLAQERQSMMIFDMGSHRINAIIVFEGRIEVVQTITQGSSDLTQALARSLAINEDRAEELKQLHGISRRSEEREIGQVLTPLIDRILLQIQRINREFTESTGRPVERVLLTGGGSQLSGLPEHTSEMLGVEVRILDAFRKVVYPPTLEPIVRSVNTSLATATGLALKGFEIT